MRWSEVEIRILPLMLLLILTISFIIKFLVSNREKNIKKTFMVITSFMLFLEAIKQLINIRNGYNYWSLPFHFCSTFMVWFSFFSFGKGKIKRTGEILSFTSSILFLIFFYYDPISVIGNASSGFPFGWTDFNSFHTFIYHHLIILFFALQILLTNYIPSLKDLLYMFYSYTIYFFIALFFSRLVDTNFASLLYSNNLYIDSLRLEFGNALYLFLMYLTAIIPSSLFIAFSIYLHRHKPSKIELINN